MTQSLVIQIALRHCNVKSYLLRGTIRCYYTDMITNGPAAYHQQARRAPVMNRRSRSLTLSVTEAVRAFARTFGSGTACAARTTLPRTRRLADGTVNMHDIRCAAGLDGTSRGRYRSGHRSSNSSGGGVGGSGSSIIAAVAGRRDVRPTSVTAAASRNSGESAGTGGRAVGIEICRYVRLSRCLTAAHMPTSQQRENVFFICPRQ